MPSISYCPLVGGRCNKSELETRVQLDTFFLAEPFKPEQDRKRRELAVRNALKEALKDGFSDASLKVSDKDPKEAIFCDICRMIQSSAYGIVDISGSNQNVLLELGMMLSLGKPVFVLVKKAEEDSLKEMLPSDIVWKRIVPFVEFIDIQEKLFKQILKRPEVEVELPLAEEVRQVVAEADPDLAKTLSAKLQEIKMELVTRLEKLLREAKLSKKVLAEKEIIVPSSLEGQIEEIYKKVERIERLAGFPEDPKIAFLRGNWHAHRKEHARALELYDWCLDLQPENAEAWNNKGVVLDQLGRHEEAIACFEEAIKIKPEDATIWANKSVALYNLDKYEDATACCDEAIKIKPDDTHAWINKGTALGQLGRYKDAIACFEEAIKIKPNHASAINSLSEMFLIVGDLAKGLEMAKKSLDLAEEARDKALSRFLCICANLFDGKSEDAQEEIEGLVAYLEGLEKTLKITGWEFSLLLHAIEERLEGENRRTLLLLISLLKGEISLKDFLKKE